MRPDLLVESNGKLVKLVCNDNSANKLQKNHAHAGFFDLERRNKGMGINGRFS